jgi:hypothetical protein
MATENSFADLLRKGIDEIQRRESLNEKKPRREIYEELGVAINRRGSTIDYYLRPDDNVPSAINELEALAREIYKRGGMETGWLEQFLIKGGHPNPATICDKLLQSQTSQPSNQPDTLYKWIKLHHYIKRRSDRTLVTTTEVELEVTADSGLESVRHRNIGEKPGELENLILNFVPAKREDYGRIEHKIDVQNPELLVWYVLFRPPLRKGQIVSYSFTQTQEFSRYWSYEEHEPYLLNSTKRYAHIRRTVLAPIEDFMFSLEFPQGYPITLPSSGGFNVYRSSAEDHLEKTRLITGGNFLARLDPVTKQWLLHLHVINAKIGLSYEIQWIPPRKDKIRDQL